MAKRIFYFGGFDFHGHCGRFSCDDQRLYGSEKPVPSRSLSTCWKFLCLQEFCIGSRWLRLQARIDVGDDAYRACGSAF